MILVGFEQPRFEIGNVALHTFDDIAFAVYFHLCVGNDFFRLDGSILENDFRLVLGVAERSVTDFLGVHEGVADGVLLHLIFLQLCGQAFKALEQFGIFLEQRVVGKLHFVDEGFHVLGTVAAEIGFSEIDVSDFVQGKHCTDLLL